MCGVIGIVESENVAANRLLYDGLTVLQHRGQDAAGIVTTDGENIYLRKDNGLVRDVFRDHHMAQLHGHAGIGHCRYPTAGCDSRQEAQPFYVNAPAGIALGHNGNLSNYQELRSQLFKEELRHLNTTSDSEVLLNLLASELHKALPVGQTHIDDATVEKALKKVMGRAQGAYSAVAIIVGYGVIAFRDRHGIRPLSWGEREGGLGRIVASESIALEVLGYESNGDVAPGGCVALKLNGETKEFQIVEPELKPCIFEYVYLARPDAIINNISVHRARMRMGDVLGRNIKRVFAENDIDVVIPVPDTSRSSALQVANQLGVPYREGFIKNRYIGRTFIMPGQESRKKGVRQKLNPMPSEFMGLNVLLVDDSIVRGNTSRQIIELVRSVGAKKVYFASAAPPVRYPNIYGIDMPYANELIAHERDEEAICSQLGADRIFYQTLDDLVSATRGDNSDVVEFELSCFNGIYLDEDQGNVALESIAERRSGEKRDNGAELDFAGMHSLDVASGS